MSVDEHLFVEHLRGCTICRRRLDRLLLLCCSFCGRTSDEVEGLIAGPQVHICNECADIWTDIITGAKSDPPE